MPKESMMVEFDIRDEKSATLFETTKRVSPKRKVRKVFRRKEDG